jgi:tetratricopeptide (TPR) repeat protein
VQQQFEQLTETHKKLLCFLAIFGNDYTEINFVISNFIDNQTPEIYEIIFDLSSQNWIDLSENKYKLTAQAEAYIYGNIPPKAQNCVKIIEFYIEKLSPPFKDRLEKNQEMQLLKVLHRIHGTSELLAKLNDYYAQYLIFAKDTKSAIKYFNLSIQIQGSENKQSFEYCNYLNHLAEAYLNTGAYDKALATAFKSRNVIDTLPKNKINASMLIYSYSIIYNVYFAQANNKKAYEYSQKAIELSDENLDDRFLQASIYYEAITIAIKTQKYDKAEEMIQKVKEKYLRTLNEKKYIEIAKRIADTEKQLNELKKINKNFNKIFNNRVFFMLLIFTVLALLAILFFI